MKSVGILSINAVAEKIPDCIRFDKGSGKFPFPEELLPIIEKVKQNIQGTYFHYPKTGGEDKLKDEIVKLERNSGRYLQPSHITVTHGGMSGLFTFFSVVSSPDDEIITNSISFEGFSTICHYFKLKQIRTDLSDIHKVEKSITKKTKVIILNSPENPTGKVYTKQEIDNLIQLAKQKKIYILSDEVVNTIIYDNVKWYGPKLESPNVVAINSFSKTWFIPGIRLGWLTTNNKVLTKKFNDAIVGQSVGVSLFSQLLMTYACQEVNYPKFLNKRLDILKKRKNLVKKCLKKYGIEYYQKIEGGVNYYVNLKRNSSTVVRELLQEHKIALIPGELFEGKRSTFARLGFGAVDEKNIVRGISALARKLQ